MSIEVITDLFEGMSLYLCYRHLFLVILPISNININVKSLYLNTITFTPKLFSGKTILHVIYYYSFSYEPFQNSILSSIVNEITYS